MVDYYCDACAKANKLTKSFRKTLHVCKYCGENKTCNDNKPLREFPKKERKK